MPVKLLMTWDIKSGHDQEYFEFMVREWLPGLQRLGLEPSDNWLTMYGNASQIMMGVMAGTLKAMHQTLDTEDWGALKSQLLMLVDNYEQKIIKATGGFQM
jgi:hypothetical protein